MATASLMTRARNSLGRVSTPGPEDNGKHSPTPAPNALLQLEAMRGGNVLTVRFDSITAWVDASQQVRGSEEMQGVRMHLANGDRVDLLLVGFDYLTGVLREHYGEQFDNLFMTEAKYETRCYVRTEHILGWTKAAGIHKLHVLGQHDLPRIQLSAENSLSTATVTVRQQPEPVVAPAALVQPLQRFPMYVEERSYDVGELVLHEGSLYRRANRNANLGNPLQRVADWEYIRTLEGSEPKRAQVTSTVTPRKPGISEYSDEASYGFGDLVSFRGFTYRKLTRSTRNGSPAGSPEDWDRVRTAQESD